MTTESITLSHRERELAGIISAYNEVTERLKESHEDLNREVRKLRLELEDKNRELTRRERLAALGRMATGVAHEIRNPLASIQLYASLLERDLRSQPELAGIVRKISLGVDALDCIVGDILDFAGGHDPVVAQVPLELLVCRVFDVAVAQAQAGGVALRMDDSLHLFEGWVDQGQVERALLNVVLNGIDAARSSVTVAAGHGGDDTIAVTVRDDGPGVDPALMEQIFNPFFTTKDRGTGLGLAIVHRILESHGGRVTVCNHPSGGAQFTLHLPGSPRGRKERSHGTDLRG